MIGLDEVPGHKRCGLSASERVVYDLCTTWISETSKYQYRSLHTCEKVVFTTVGVTAAPIPRVVIGISGLSESVVTSSSRVISCCVEGSLC